MWQLTMLLAADKLCLSQPASSLQHPCHIQRTMVVLTLPRTPQPCIPVTTWQPALSSTGWSTVCSLQTCIRAPSHRAKVKKNCWARLQAENLILHIQRLSSNMPLHGKAYNSSCTIPTTDLRTSQVHRVRHASREQKCSNSREQMHDGSSHRDGKSSHKDGRSSREQRHKSSHERGVDHKYALSGQSDRHRSAGSVGTHEQNSRQPHSRGGLDLDLTKQHWPHASHPNKSCVGPHDRKRSRSPGNHSYHINK